MDRTQALPAAVLTVLVAALACGDAAGPGQTDECRNAEDLEACLPSWQEYSPLEQEQAPTPDPDAVSSSEVTEALERIDSTGATISLGNVTFVCTDSTYNFLDNPDRAVSFNLDETVLWPGALIQGKSHRDGASAGGLLELPIRERAPLSVSITFNNQDNTRLVENPDFGSVNAARGSMIGNAQAEGLATANNIEFSAETYSSERQAALAFGVSGRYLGFEASASGSVERSVTTNVVAAKFIQQMYIVGVTQPATPADFFSEAFTEDRYRSHAGFGRIGPSNPPLYVSRMGFGRMMVFAMSAKAEASEISGTLRASWQGIGASAGATLSAKQQAILQQSEIRITQVGGDQQNALNAIRSGQLADYFTDTAPLTSAAPLWFELKSLTGEVAQVSEPGEYTVTTCTPKLPGTFDYQAEQMLTIPFTAGTQRQVVPADVNGDGRMDLVYNERQSAPSLNRVHVAVAGGAGTYTLAAPATHTASPSQGWESFELLAADVDGDGRDDLVWNHRGTNNVVYAGMSHGDGSFTWRAEQVHEASGWSPYDVTTGDLNGDGRTDLLWNNRGSTTVMRTYFGLARDDSTFSMHPNFVDRSGNYTGYRPPLVGNFNGDPYGDIVLNAVGASYNNTYVARFTPTSDSTGTLSWASPLVRSESGWQDYQWVIGDVDGVNGTDLIWVNGSRQDTVWIHRALNTGSGTFTVPTDPKLQQVFMTGSGSLAYVADFNNDGRSDLLINRRSSSVNELIVGFGTAGGSFTFPAGLQEHQDTPTAGWATYDQVFVADVNSDGKADIIWTTPASDARVYVALAK